RAVLHRRDRSAAPCRRNRRGRGRGADRPRADCRIRRPRLRRLPEELAAMMAELAAPAQRPDRARRVRLVFAGALACIGALAGSLADSLVGANGGAAVAQAAAADSAGTHAEAVAQTAPQ